MQSVVLQLSLQNLLQARQQLSHRQAAPIMRLQWRKGTPGWGPINGRAIPGTPAKTEQNTTAMRTAGTTNTGQTRRTGRLRNLAVSIIAVSNTAESHARSIC